ncbi:MAG TPA: cadherin-like domain-containing protein, partial [Microvirga sp.]
AWTYTATSAHDALKEGEKVSDTFTVKSADGTETSVTINITGTNDAPKLTGQQTQLPSGEEDGTYTFATADLLKGFTDVDGGPLSVVDVTASNGTLVNNGGTWTYTPNLNYNGPVTLNYTVIDGKGGSAPGSLEFSLAPVNDAPVNTVASAQTIGSGQTLVFSGANKISIADVDVGSAPLTVTLTGQNGTITLGGSTSGMTVSGDGTGTVTLTGTLSQINGALDNLQFKAATNFGGAGGITINTNDNGNIGSGGALTDTDTIAITINQAGPGAGGGPAPTPISFLVEEDDLSGGVNDNGSSTLVKTGTVASLFSGSGYTYSLVAPSLPAMTSKGQALTYAVAGTTLFAFIESNSTAGYQSGVERAVFSFDLKPNGDYTFTLLDALDHTGSPGTNILLNLGGAIKATDQFGNSATAASTAFKVDVVDDVPVAVESQEGLVINKGGQSGTFNLDTDANIDNNFGIDGAQVSFPTSLSGDSGLTSGGAAISYRVSSDGRTLTAFTGSGVTESTVFTVVLNPDGSTVANDKYTVTMLRAVDAPVTSNDFASGVYQFSGGNNPWAGFRTDANDNSQDLLLTPMAGGVSGSTMNTTNTAGGVGSGASVNTGEAVRLDFVTDLSGNNSGTNAGYGDAINQDHSFDGHYLTNGASTFISGLAQKTANILVKAFDDPDGAAGSTALKTVGDGTKDVINSVAITYNGTTKVASGSNTVVTLTFGLEPSAVSVKVNFTATGEALVEGIRNDTRIAVFTADKYNSLEFHHAGGDTFVIGGFGSTVSTAGSTVDFALPVQLRDGDGDIATGQLTLNLRPDGITPTVGNDTAETLSVSSGNDIIYARGGNDTVNASDGSDALSGGSGNDTLSGGNGNDRLTGGSGKDLMTGGADGDTFIFLAVNDSPAAVATRDVITDFTPSSDLINLAGIDANSLVNGNQAFTFGGETSSVLANQVTWYFDTASNTAIVQADVNGDTTADLQIQLNGWDATKKLLVSDFVL